MGPVRLEAITWERLGDLLAERLLDLKPDDGSPWPRIAFDGAPAARPGELAHRVSEALRIRGRSSLVVGTEGFLRPASLRLEYGHQDVEAYYDGWFDTSALWREVFGPLEAGGNGRVLPDLWDPATDRATRSSSVQLPPGGLLLLHGPSFCATGSRSTSVSMYSSPRAPSVAVLPRPSTGPSPPSSATRTRWTRAPRPTSWCEPTIRVARRGTAEPSPRRPVAPPAV